MLPASHPGCPHGCRSGSSSSLPLPFLGSPFVTVTIELSVLDDGDTIQTCDSHKLWTYLWLLRLRPNVILWAEIPLLTLLATEEVHPHHHSIKITTRQPLLFKCILPCVCRKLLPEFDILFEELCRIFVTVTMLARYYIIESEIKQPDSHVPS